ncbi:MAG: DMT family transporter [Deltaproteobacteria bacterium]|nr:DMT family transporter [Deltaproteobacteria bacterium]
MSAAAIATSTTVIKASDAGGDLPAKHQPSAPWYVAIGSGLWGSESAFRIPLTEGGRYGKSGLYASDVLVLIEHVLILITFLPWLWLQRRTWPKRIPLRTLGYLAISGVAGSAVGTVFFTEALRTGNPTVVNLLLNVQPVISTFGGWAVHGERPNGRFWLWAPVALGAGLLLSGDPTHAAGASWWGISTLYTLLCALAWGAGTVVGRGAMKELPVAVASTIRVMVGLVCMAGIVAARGRFDAAHLLPAQASAGSWVMLVALATVSGGIPLAIYFRGLRGTPASLAGYFEQMQTLVAVVITWGVFGHGMDARQVIAGLVLIGAVTMLQRQGTVDEKGSVKLEA